ncbi:MAG: helix-turn-helix domain-containing protein [Cellulosilyticaceae bacterium]
MNRLGRYDEMGYESTLLTQKIMIHKIITIHYFEYMNDFVFKGERHNFWEFLCVDKGEVEVGADNRTYKLGKRDIIFHKPMEFHTVKAESGKAPNLVVMSFESMSTSMNLFENKVFKLEDAEWNLISKIIIEAQNAYATPLNIPAIEKVERSVDAPFGAEQLIKLYLEELLILLARKNKAIKSKSERKIASYIIEKSDINIVNRINFYLERNLSRQVTVDEICKDNLLSRSYVQKFFHNHYGCGVMEYFNTLKISTAKQMIRSKSMNFTEIAESLGYSSIHSFSKQFKRITGMTPTEYSNSIKMHSENI